MAAYFEISRSEAQRVKAVAQLDPTVAQDILNADKRPAEEVIYTIANRPPQEQAEAYKRYGHLTVATVRKLEHLEKAEAPAGKVTGPGRPRNFTFAVRDEAFDVTHISTALTPAQWKKKGGARAFWKAIQQLVNSREMQDRLESELS